LRCAAAPDRAGGARRRAPRRERRRGRGVGVGSSWDRVMLLRLCRGVPSECKRVQGESDADVWPISVESGDLSPRAWMRMCVSLVPSRVAPFRASDRTLRPITPTQSNARGTPFAHGVSTLVRTARPCDRTLRSTDRTPARGTRTPTAGDAVVPFGVADLRIPARGQPRLHQIPRSPRPRSASFAARAVPCSARVHARIL
jgi:hypothetical protein